jgi:hypothetical protein
MRLDELKRNKFPCQNCGNSKIVPAGGGSFAVGIECSLSKSLLWLANEEEIQNCKNFITYEQYERQKKINKITKSL